MRNGRKGYILEVDEEYPIEMHEKHNNLPFISKKMEIDKVEKLVPILYNKKKYVVHIRTLKKVHRVISLQQKAFMKVYIDKNTELRKEAPEAGNKFEKAFFKLMNSSVFGKTIENIRKHKTGDR